MLAAFLEDADGGFDIAGLAIALAGAWLSISAALWFLPKAIRTGRMPYGFGTYGSNKTYWLEREKHPAWFWILFALYLFMMPFGILIISLGLFGWGRKQN
jgi:ABC-type Fe3+ transport system permease subunit